MFCWFLSESRRQRFQLEPQAAFGPKDELGEAAGLLGGGGELGVLPRAKAKPEERQRHDHSQLGQSELLPDAVPARGRRFTSVAARGRGGGAVVPGSGGEGDEGVGGLALLV